MNTERARMLANVPGRDGWHHWGPYLSERQWGTVREDYSPGGTAWEDFPHYHARSRAYLCGCVEWLRSHIEGALVRRDQRRGQSRRRRQGTLLLSGCHPHAFVSENAL